MKKLADHTKGLTEDALDQISDPAMRSRLQRLQQSMQEPKHKERIAAQKRIDEAQKKAATNVVQLPLWPEPARGVPNSILRSALFAAIQGKDRRTLKRELLTAMNGIEVRFTGLQLDQSDMDVFEQALHLARQHPLGTRCDFTAHAFLKMLGRKTGKSGHEWLKDVYARLIGCGVEITHAGKTYGGSLLKFYRDEETGRYVVVFDPDMLKLYNAGWTATDWTQRQLLKRKPLALWLHGFYSSHAEPYPMKMETLIRLSGSGNKNRRSYTTKMKNAHDDLKAVGAIDSYSIDGDLVGIKRIPSDSQKKHLRKAKPRKK